MANAILNFHFDFLTPSLSIVALKRIMIQLMRIWMALSNNQSSPRELFTNSVIDDFNLPTFEIIPEDLSQR